MEEILASIKRVIAEDGRVAPRPARRPARPAPAPAPSEETAEAADADEEDVLELDDPVSETRGLMSDDVAAASRQRLAALSALRERAETPPDTSALEAVVRDMLRPMLKAWLDERLPEIVEDLVTREIARITGRHL